MSQNLHLIYLVCSVCFILALKGLASPKDARRGNVIGIWGMVVAIASAFFNPLVQNYVIVFVTITSFDLYNVHDHFYREHVYDHAGFL